MIGRGYPFDAQLPASLSFKKFYTHGKGLSSDNSKSKLLFPWSLTDGLLAANPQMFQSHTAILLKASENTTY
jgi:hypothetical protein